METTSIVSFDSTLFEHYLLCIVYYVNKQNEDVTVDDEK